MPTDLIAADFKLAFILAVVGLNAAEFILIFYSSIKINFFQLNIINE